MAEHVINGIAIDFALKQNNIGYIEPYSDSCQRTSVVDHCNKFTVIIFRETSKKKNFIKNNLFPLIFFLIHRIDIDQYSVGIYIMYF